MALDQQLLEILACPDTHHAPLEHDPGAQTLTCTECGRVFEIRDDIPILLLDEARLPGAGTPARPTEDGSVLAGAGTPADGSVQKPAADGVAEAGQRGAGETATDAPEKRKN